MAEPELPQTSRTETRTRGRKRTAVVLLLLFGALAAAVALAWYMWRQLGDVTIGAGGLAVLVGGVTVTLALGAGLVALMVLSDRRGYDKGLGRE